MLTLFYIQGCFKDETITKHLRIGNGAEPETLDPQKCGSVTCIRILHSLFEGLTRRSQGEFVSGIARWQVDSTATKYHFSLSPVRWQDKTPLTAYDVEYAWRRLQDPETGAPYSTLLEGVKSYRALSADTFYVELKAPMAYFLELCSFGPLMPVPKHIVDKYGPAWTQVENITSNGPYKLTHWIPNQKIVIEADSQYNRAKEVQIKKISYLPVDDNNTEYMLFLSGQLDWIYQVPSARLKYWQDKPEFNNSPKYGTYLMRINQNFAGLQNPKAKLALNLAIDRQLIVESVTQGGEQAATGLVPNGVSDYTPYRPYAFNPDSARALWAQAKAEGPLTQEFELLYNQSEGNKKIAEALSQMWKNELGITVKLANVEWKTLLSQMKNLEYEVIRGSWIGDYQDPITFLELFQSQSGNNRAGYKSPVYDSLLNASIYETDRHKRMNILAQLEKHLLDDPPIIPIYFYRNKELRNQAIKGIVENPLGLYNYSEMRLERP